MQICRGLGVQMGPNRRKGSRFQSSTSPHPAGWTCPLLLLLPLFCPNNRPKHFPSRVAVKVETNAASVSNIDIKEDTRRQVHKASISIPNPHSNLMSLLCLVQVTSQAPLLRGGLHPFLPLEPQSITSFKC